MRITRLLATGLVWLVLFPSPCLAGRGHEPTRDPQWIADSLDPEVRTRVHFHASDVPRFPKENSALIDPRRWPVATVVNGTRCRLRIEASKNDVTGLPLRSLDDLSPGQSLSLSYSPDGGGSFDRYGPVYIWSPSRRLRERYWVEPDPKYRITTGYGYYNSGELYRYATSRRRKVRSGAPFEWFTEYFERDGRLAGVGYSRLDGQGKRVLAFYRYGRSVSYDDFELRVGLPQP